MAKPTPIQISWVRFSIKGMLLFTMLVAAFFGGRLWHEFEVERAKLEEPAPPAPIATTTKPLKFTVTQYQNGKWMPLNTTNRPIQVIPYGWTEGIDLLKPKYLNDAVVRERPAANEISDSIEQGMKATELEMRQRFTR